MRRPIAACLAALIATAAAAGQAPHAQTRREAEARIRALLPLPPGTRLTLHGRVTPQHPLDRRKALGERQHVGLNAGGYGAAAPEVQWDTVNNGILLTGSGLTGPRLRYGAFAGLAFLIRSGNRYVAYCTQDRTGGTVAWDLFLGSPDTEQAPPTAVPFAGTDFAFSPEPIAGPGGAADLRFTVTTPPAGTYNYIRACWLFSYPLAGKSRR